MELPESIASPSQQPTSDVWPEHLPNHARQLHLLFKSSLLALASGDPSDRQSALEQFSNCSKSLAQRLVRSVATLEPPEPGSKQAIHHEIAKLRHHIYHQRQTIASTRARLTAWFDQLAAQSDLAHDVIEARAHGGKLPHGIGIGSPAVSSSLSSSPVANPTNASSSATSPITTTDDGPRAVTSTETSATASMLSASTSESKPGSSTAMDLVSDLESSARFPVDDDQSSAVSGYPSTSGGDTMADDDDDDSSLPSDWEERINAQSEAEVIAAQAGTGHIVSDRQSSLSGFVVEDDDTMAPISVMDNVSSISDVVMMDVEQHPDQASAAGAIQPSEAMGDADVDSISLSGLGSEIPSGMHTPPVPAVAMTHPAIVPEPAPAPAAPMVPPKTLQQPLQNQARPMHPFNSASAFLQGDSDSSSEEDDDD